MLANKDRRKRDMDKAFIPSTEKLGKLQVECRHVGEIGDRFPQMSVGLVHSSINVCFVLPAKDMNSPCFALRRVTDDSCQLWLFQDVLCDWLPGEIPTT